MSSELLVQADSSRAAVATHRQRISDPRRPFIERSNLSVKWTMRRLSGGEAEDESRATLDALFADDPAAVGSRDLRHLGESEAMPT